MMAASTSINESQVQSVLQGSRNSGRRVMAQIRNVGEKWFSGQPKTHGRSAMFVSIDGSLGELVGESPG